MTTESPIVDEVRRRATEISRRFGDDPGRYLDYLQKKQQEPRFRGRIVNQLTVVAASPIPTDH